MGTMDHATQMGPFKVVALADDTGRHFLAVETPDKYIQIALLDDQTRTVVSEENKP